MTTARSALPPELAAALASNPALAARNPGLAFVVDAAPKQSKYGNVRTTYAGRVYDSEREAKRAGELDLLKRAGEIVAWFAQVPFELPGGVIYIADFVVVGKDWRAWVEDTKGFRTPEYKIKRRQFKEKYGIEIVEL